MPCIWGRHNNSQVFLNVAILEDGTVERLRPDQSFILHVFKALIDTGIIGIGSLKIDGDGSFSYSF